MSDADLAVAAIRKALEDFAELGDLVKGYSTTAYSRFERWLYVTTEVLAEVVSEREAKAFSITTAIHSGTDYLELRARRAQEILVGLTMDIPRYPARVLRPVVPASADTDIRLSREGVFFKGAFFDALLFVGDVFAQAKASILIVDGYPGEKLLALLQGKGPGVTVRILALESPRDPNRLARFKTLADAFHKQYGPLEVRASLTFHDRFVVVDNKDFYHFGASLNDVGSKGFMFSVIEELAVVAAVRKAIEDDWLSAAPL